MLQVTLSKNTHTLKSGQAYVMENVNAGQMIMTQDCRVTELRRKDYKDRQIHDSVLFTRPGGMGDLLFLNPVLRIFKERNPGVKVGVAVDARFRQVVETNPYVDELVQYPIRRFDFDRWQSHVWLENIIEFSERGKLEHPVVLYLEAAGIDPDSVPAEEKQNQVWLTDEDLKAQKRFPRVPGVKRVGVQLKASATCRTPQDMGPILTRFWAEGWQVVCFGAPGEVKIQADGKKIINLTNQKKPLSMRQSFAVMQTCDLFIAPDSGLLHASGALDVPAVGMYGPFPGNIRTKYSPRTTVIEGKAPCAPCFWHSRGMLFPADCPSRSEGKCQVLESIPHGEVFEIGKRVSR